MNREDTGSSDGGFILLKSLIGLAGVLICAGIICGAIAGALRNARVLRERMAEEFEYRAERLEERLK
jgi:hypothetical protein